MTNNFKTLINLLAYKPKPKAEAAKKRQRKARKIERDKAK